MKNPNLALTIAVVALGLNGCRQRADAQFHNGVYYGCMASSEYLKAGSNNVTVGQIEVRARELQKADLP